MTNLYINTDTKEYPVFENQLRYSYNDGLTLFTDVFDAPDGYALVLETPVPIYDPIRQTYRELAPAKDSSGNWLRTYEVYDLDPEHIAVNQASKAQQITEDIVHKTQIRLDDFAKTRNYDGILSLSTYATSTNAKFQAEGQYGVEARDATWAKLYEILGEVEAGTRPMPTGYGDIEPELPALEWPLS